MSSGVASLHVRGTGERRESDDVTDCVDVRDGGLEVVVDLQLFAAVCFEAQFVQTQAFCVPRSADRGQHDVGLNLLTGLQRQHDTIVLAFH